MMASDDFRLIDSAPRDGRYVQVIADGDGPFEMRWNAAGTNPLVSKDMGIWEARGGEFTWCEDSGFGPTHWRPVPIRSAVAR